MEAKYFRTNSKQATGCLVEWKGSSFVSHSKCYDEIDTSCILQQVGHQITGSAYSEDLYACRGQWSCILQQPNGGFSNPTILAQERFPNDGIQTMYEVQERLKTNSTIFRKVISMFTTAVKREFKCDNTFPQQVRLQKAQTSDQAGLDC